MAQILYGDVSPSGRLPYTVAKQATDYGDLLSPCQAPRNSLSPQCDFAEGPNIDYRSFLARNMTPRFEFGFGLTYSTFNYSDLVISVNATATANNTIVAPVYANGTTNNNDSNNNTALIGVGGLESLFTSVGTVEATITNTGTVAAAEVAQLYLQIPTKYTNSTNPVTRVLRGFQKVTIQPNATARVSFDLRAKDVSSWDMVRQAWVVPKGQFNVWVGKSVLDTPLVGKFAT